MLTKSRASMYTLDIETEQRDLIIQNLHSSRQAAITYLEQLESGDSIQHNLKSSKSNRLRKPKTASKRDQTKDPNIQKERASDWVKSLIRDERNNALIAHEFSPCATEDTGGLQGIKDRKLNVGEREVRAGVGELQGDGPDDLPSRSERMEYAWGWPKS